jgi:hypothetical protein
MQRTSRRLGVAARSRWLHVLLVLCVLAVPTSPAHALMLYDNGPITDGTSDGRCDSGFTPSCGGSGDWTFYDDFNFGTDATVTGFDYADFFLFGSPANYVETEWSLFDADPFTSAPIASGTAAALLSAAGPADLYWFEVSGLAVGLSAGVTYWLGIHNRVSGEISTTVARVDNPGGGLDAAKQSDSAANDIDLPAFENRAFRIHGTVIPEPSTALLFAVGLVGIAAGRRLHE